MTAACVRGRRGKRRGRCALVLLTLLLLTLAFAACLPQGVKATFPGRNGSIAFSFSDTSAGAMSIVTVPRNGGTARTIYTGGEPFSGPNELRISWRRDGRRLATEREITATFGDSPSAGLRIVTMSPAGRSIRSVTPPDLDGRYPEHPTWSPDGARVAFEMQGYIYTIQANGQHLVMVARGSAPAWSVSGLIAFTRGGDIWVTRAGAAAPHRMIHDGDGADWAPDGRRLLFDRVTHGFVQVFLAGAAGRPLRQLTHGPGSNLEPSFSPDGRYVVYVDVPGRRAAQRPRSFYYDSLWIMRSDGSGAHMIRNGFAPDPSGSSYVEDPAWQPLPR